MVQRVMLATPSSPDLSFPKTRRLVATDEFARVKTEGTAHRGRTLVLGVLARDGGEIIPRGLCYLEEDWRGRGPESRAPPAA